MMAGRPWGIPGAARQLSPADRELTRLRTCARRAPGPDDAPKLSTLPVSSAAREALRLTHKYPFAGVTR